MTDAKLSVRHYLAFVDSFPDSLENCRVFIQEKDESNGSSLLSTRSRVFTSLLHKLTADQSATPRAGGELFRLGGSDSIACVYLEWSF